MLAKKTLIPSRPGAASRRKIVSPLPVNAGWSPKKVAAFEKAFWEFAGHARINSKEKGGGYRIADGVYTGQKRFMRALWDGLAEDKHTIKCLKSRQLGISTIVELLVTFWIGIFDGIQGGVVFDTGPHTAAARRRIKTLINNLPESYKFPRIVADNRDGLTLANQSQLLFMSAGVRETASSGTLGRASGLNLLWGSELCSWQNTEGLTSLKNALSQTFPNRLYIEESTARSFNVWHDEWMEAKGNEIEETAFFAGWWAKDDQRISRGTQLWAVYGADQPSEAELRRIAIVKELYDFDVDLEQLAWYRRYIDPTRERDDEETDDSYAIQDQPWCVTADTRVGTNRGIKRIDEIATGDETALGRVLHVGPTGRARIWAARTKLGYLVKGTANHPLIARDNSEIELAQSERQVIRLHPPKFAKEEHVVSWADGIIQHSVAVTADFARLVGIFMGDGSISGQGNRTGFEFNIACDAQDRDIIEECHRLVRQLFGVNTQERTIVDERFAGAKGWVQIRATSKLIYNTFASLKLIRGDTGKTMRRVHVPEFIWRSPPHVVKEFLSGVFEADGFHADKAYRCSLASKWIEFLRDVQLLLLGFGITSRLSSRAAVNGAGRQYQDNQLMLRARECELFNEKIGFLSARKRERGIKRPSGKTPGHPLPIEMFDEVVSVQDTGVAATVWNLSVDGNHWFDANGIVTHNTEEEAFQQSGSPFFRSDKLTVAAHLSKSLKFRPYRFWPGDSIVNCDVQPAKTWKEVELKVWEDPTPESCYVVSGDPAFGRNEFNDNSCAQVMRCYADGLEQVAEFTSAVIEPHQFAWLLWTLVGWYGSAHQTEVTAICELNGSGEEVLRQYNTTRKMLRDGYLRNAARESGINNIFHNGKNYIYSRSDSMDAGKNWWWKTTSQLKVQMMDGLRGYFHNDMVTIRSYDALEEMKTIAREGDKIQAPSNKRDDRNSALAFAVRAWEERLRGGLARQNRTREADRIRRAGSPVDIMALFQKNLLEDMFKRKAAGRRMAQIAALQRPGFRMR